MAQNMKKCIYTSKLELWVEFFVVNDIDIHQLNLRTFRSSEFLVENSLQNVYFALV